MLLIAIITQLHVE